MEKREFKYWNSKQCLNALPHDEKTIPIEYGLGTKISLNKVGKSHPELMNKRYLTGCRASKSAITKGSPVTRSQRPQNLPSGNAVICFGHLKGN